MEDTLSFAGQSNKWNTAADAAAVVDAIDRHRNLKVLDLENNTLGPEAAKIIGDALSRHPEFERAHFKDLFTGRLKTEIPLALKHLFSGINRSGAKLVELDLSDNALGPVGVEGMVDFMSSSACYTLQELRLNNNGLGITGGTMLAKSLEKLLENSERDGQPWKLKVFIAGRNRLEKVGAKIFASIFKRLGSLEEVVMPQNGIFHEGIAALAEALSFNPNLRVLNLNDNTFTKKGAVAMAKYLKHMLNLEVINFGDCLIKTSGAMELAMALLDKHEKLRELYLDGNEMTAEGGLSIAEAIQNKSDLEKLGMDDNMFGESGRDMIETFLKDVEKFHTLLPMENNMEPDSDSESSAEEEECGSGDDAGTDEPEVARVSSDGEDTDIEVVGAVTAAASPATPLPADLNSSLIVGPVTTEPCTTAQFVEEPSPARLLGVQVSGELKNLAAEAAEKKSCVSADQEISAALELLVKVAGFGHTSDNALRKAVAQAVVEIGQFIFKVAKDNLLVSFTTNSLLVHLGLIKCEDKNFTPTREHRALLISLAELLQQDYFPQDSKNTLSYFIDRPSPSLDAHPQEKNRVLALLK